MEEIIYITPNGSEVDEVTLRNKYGERFDQLVADNILKKKDSSGIATDLNLETGISDLPEPDISQEPTGFFESNFGQGGFFDLLDDTVLDIRRGVAQGQSLNEALRLQRKGSNATAEDVEEYIQAVNKMESIPVTDEMRNFQRIYEENDKSWLGFIKGVYANPSALSGVVAQSVASMINPTVALGSAKTAGATALALGGAGLAAGGPAAGLAGLGIGARYGAILGLTNTLEAGLAFTEFLQEEIDKNPNLEFNDEGIAAILNDDEAFRRVKSRTKKRGYSIAAVNAITYGVAGQLARAGRKMKRLKDIKVADTKIPISRVVPGPQTAIRSGTEFLGGGLGEVAGRAAAGQEMDAAEIGFEAFGELASPEALIPTFKNATYTIDGERVNQVDIIDMLEGDPEALLESEITIKNDEALDVEVKAAVKRAVTERNVKNGLTPEQRKNITKDQLKNLVDLQLELDQEKNSESQVGEDNAIETKQKIKEITDAIQEPSTETIPVPKQPETSPTVREGDTQGAEIAGEITSEQIETTTQPAEEVETQIETQEGEIETYTLPEDLKEREADFEIIDNEKGQQGFEIDEEGNGKWIITNIKTGFFLPLKTKADTTNELQNIRIGENMFDYGEGAPVLEEFRIQKEESRPLKRKIKNLVDKITDPPEGRGPGFEQKWFNPIVMERAGIIKDEDVKEYYLQSIESGESINDISQEFYKRDFKRLGIPLPEQITQQFDSPFAYKNTPTQEERLIKLTKKRGELTASEAAEELQILEPNIRRIFGQGAKTGKFERVGRGVYRITTPDNKSYGVIETANAISTLKRLVKEKVKFDFIYLDPPYKSQGGKRNTGKFENFITKQDFAEVASLVGKLVRNKNTPVVFQYPVTKFTQEGSQRRKEEASFLKSLRDAGLDIAADFAPIELVKLDKQGKEKFHMRGRTLRENVFFLTKSGKIGDIPLDFTETEGIRELRYPQVDIRSKEFKRFGGRTRKNIDFMINLVESLTVPGAQVLDPFVGTGTTIQAAIATGRDAMGIEIEESTADIAKKEIERTTPKQKTKSKPKPEPKKTLQKEASKKVKQTVPKKPKKETKEEAPPTEIDKTIDELGAKGVDKITAKILRTNFGNVYAKIKNIFAKGKGVVNVVQEQLRSIPTTKVDFILGNENSTLFYRKLFLPLVKSYQQYADRFKQKQKVIEGSRKKLLKESKGNSNKAKINSFKIAIAQKARIHEANPDSNVTPPVVDLLNFTIRLGKAGKLNGVNKRTALELEKLRDEYIEDGVITFDKVYNSLTPTQKSVYNTLQEENRKLESFAKTAADRRGITLEMLNDYSHRVVLATRNEEIDITEQQAKDFSDQTTRGRNLLERTEGVKAVSFDPFLSSLRGTQEVYLDYYMSPDVSKVQQIAAGLVKKYENGNEGQIAATIGIEETLRELLRVTYLRSFVPSRFGTNIATEAKKIGYRLLLGSAPRFVAELAGNSAMLIAEKPSVVRDAVTKYAPFSMKVSGEANTKYINLLTEVGSGETDKLGGRLRGDSKYSDRSGILNISRDERNLYNPFLNKLEQLSKLPKTLTYDFIAQIQDILMSGGDVIISRPIWVSKFADQFKQNVKNELGETINISVEDLNKMADGKSIYLTDSKYKKALNKAVTEADRTVINISTSANPFNAITKNVKRGDVKDYYRTINSFMANFTLNEYATARMAIGALVNSGEMSPRNAGLLLAGVLGRMSSYVIVYGLLADLMDEALFEAPEEDDEDLDSLIYRQLIGSVMTLMFRQNLGNIASLPINLGIEEFNKQYLEELRDGKPYNSYDNSIVYSLITLDRLEKGIDKQIVPILTGPYVEYYKTARRAIELYNRTRTRKTQEARDRALRELEEVIGIQAIGQLGLLPFYKDIVRSKRKKFYKENYESSSGSGSGTQAPVKR